MIQDGIASGIESLPTTLGMMGLALTGVPAPAALTAMGAITGGQTFITDQKAGLPYWKSLISSTSDATVEAVTEALPLAAARLGAAALRPPAQGAERRTDERAGRGAAGL